VQKSAQLNLHVGIGPVAARLDGAAESRRMADRVVQVLAETAGHEVRIATEEQVRSRIALLDLAGQGVADGETLLTPVRRLVEHDAEHGTAYAATLLAFLDAFGEAARAAQVLSVHENTLRYRIRRLEELFDLDLADPADRLVIWLQLRLRQIRGDR
jgi:DNA-binding PucR family transcriptional regulator